MNQRRADATGPWPRPIRGTSREDTDALLSGHVVDADPFWTRVPPSYDASAGPARLKALPRRPRQEPLWTASAVRAAPRVRLDPADGWHTPALTTVLYSKGPNPTTSTHLTVPDGEKGKLGLVVHLPSVAEDPSVPDMRFVDDETQAPVQLATIERQTDDGREATYWFSAVLGPGRYRWELRAPSEPIKLGSLEIVVDLQRA